MIYIVTVSDTITYERTIEITVNARSKNQATAKALARVDEEMAGDNDTLTEEQIDNTPYEVISVHT